MIDVSIQTLKPGLKVLQIPLPINSVTLLFLANFGSRYEKADQNGIAHFFEHTVFKGTKKYPDAQVLASTVDGIGADFNAFTSKEYTGYYVKTVAKHFDLAVDVLTDMIFSPRLNTVDIEREKGVIIEELKTIIDNPIHYNAYLFDRMVYQGTGLSHDTIGTKQSIQAIKRENFIQMLQDWYGYGNLLLVICGNQDLLKRGHCLTKVAQSLDKLEQKRYKNKVKLDQYLSQQPISNQRFHLEYRQTEQAHITMGWPAIKRRSDKRYALAILSTIIGANMSSRLFTELREKRGLCYYVRSDVDQFHDGGVFGAMMGVDAKRVNEAIEVANDEFKAVFDGSKSITQQEFQRAKDYIWGKLILSFEDSETVAQYFGLKYLLMDKIETPAELIKRIRAVKQEEVEALAREIIKAGELRLAVLGPYQDKAQFKSY